MNVCTYTIINHGSQCHTLGAHTHTYITELKQLFLLSTLWHYHSDHTPSLNVPKGDSERSSKAESIWTESSLSTRFALRKEYHQLFIVVSETKHFWNTFLKLETIEMIPESIVLPDSCARPTTCMMKMGFTVMVLTSKHFWTLFFFFSQNIASFSSLESRV